MRIQALQSAHLQRYGLRSVHPGHVHRGLPADWSILTSFPDSYPVYIVLMATNSTLLCIHRDPTQLSLLTEHGYELETATNGSEGLRLFMSRPVDAVVLEYHLGLLDGSTIADEIKHIRPEVPIVMLVDHVELPIDAVKSVDALVAKADGPHFLLATVHFVLNVNPAQRRAAHIRSQPSPRFQRLEKSRRGLARRRVRPSRFTGNDNDKEAPFSRSVWRSIQDGTIQF
jgi:CheY-like chemotaxis protein